jgi:hypothetical protein
MKTELEKFIRKEPASKFISHFIYLLQLYYLEEQYNKENGSMASVFPILLQYIIWGNESKNKDIKYFMDGITDKLDKIQ